MRSAAGTMSFTSFPSSQRFHTEQKPAGVERIVLLGEDVLCHTAISRTSYSRKMSLITSYIYQTEMN